MYLCTKISHCYVVIQGLVLQNIYSPTHFYSHIINWHKIRFVVNLGKLWRIIQYKNSWIAHFLTWSWNIIWIFIHSTKQILLYHNFFILPLFSDYSLWLDYMNSDMGQGYLAQIPAAIARGSPEHELSNV